LVEKLVQGSVHLSAGRPALTDEVTMIRSKPEGAAKKRGGGAAGKATRVRKGIAGNKLSELEAMLRRPEGATIAQLAETLSWQPHSVRGALSGSLKKQKGLKIASAKEEGRERVYRITE
jgi:hypothetical protein